MLYVLPRLVTACNQGPHELRIRHCHALAQLLGVGEKERLKSEMNQVEAIVLVS